VNLLKSLLNEGKIDELEQIIDSQACTTNLWIKLAHKYKSIHNHEMQHLKELFVKQMREDGYNVVVDGGEDDAGCADTEELFEKIDMERQVIRSHQIFNAPNIDKNTYEGIKACLTSNESDRIAATKYFLTQIQLPGIMETESWSPELVQMLMFGKRGLTKQLENFHYLLNPEMAETNHIAAWMPVIQTGSTWLPDQLERSRLPLIKCGRFLGFHELLGKEISVSDLDEIFTKVTESRLYQSSLKFSFNPKKSYDSVKEVKKWLNKFAIKLSKMGEFFIAVAMKDGTSKYAEAPKYEALTPELIELLKVLNGGQYTSDNVYIQELGKTMEDLEIIDARGRMALIAGAARYLGIVVTSSRHRTKNSKGKDIIPRVYTFSDLPNPISNAIRDTHVRPTNKEIKFADIYECLSKRLIESNSRQRERIKEWQEAKAQGENPPIPMNDLRSIAQIQCSDLIGTSDLASKRLTIEMGDRVTISATKLTGIVIDFRVHSWTTPKGNSGSANQCLVEFEGGRQQWYDIDVLTIVD
jgi:hypothetical protein